MESLICILYLSVAARTIVWADRSLRYTSLLLGCWATNEQISKPGTDTSLPCLQDDDAATATVTSTTDSDGSSVGGGKEEGAAASGRRKGEGHASCHDNPRVSGGDEGMAWTVCAEQFDQMWS